jgi:hypothetical protein
MKTAPMPGSQGAPGPSPVRPPAAGAKAGVTSLGPHEYCHGVESAGPRRAEAGTGGPARHGPSIALGEGYEQAKRFQHSASCLLCCSTRFIYAHSSRRRLLSRPASRTQSPNLQQEAGFSRRLGRLEPRCKGFCTGQLRRTPNSQRLATAQHEPSRPRTPNEGKDLAMCSAIGASILRPMQSRCRDRVQRRVRGEVSWPGRSGWSMPRWRPLGVGQGRGREARRC